MGGRPAGMPHCAGPLPRVWPRGSFNKREEDFETAREYDDYLEMVEDISTASLRNALVRARWLIRLLPRGGAPATPVYNLTNNVDVEATTARVKQYRQENADLIARNRAIAVRAARWEQAMSLYLQA